MKKIIVLTLVSAAAVFAQNGSAPAAQPQQQKALAGKAKKLTRVELDTLLARPDTLLIDVRRPDEVTAIGGFPAYLSIQAADLENQLVRIPKDRVIVTVSNHAARATKAADVLDSKGFNVAGAVGVEDYESEGGHITKIPVPPPSANTKK